MRLRKGVKLRAPPTSPIRYTEDAHGLVRVRGRFSGQSTLSEIEKAIEAATMAVAVAQPHRANVFDARGNVVASSEDKRLGSALGRFCLRHRPRPLAPWLQDAGEEYHDVVYRWKRAMGFLTPASASEP